MNTVCVILDDLYDEEEKEKLIQIQRKFDITSISIIKTKDRKPMLDTIMSQADYADYMFFKDQSILDQCQISKQFMEDFLKQINKTGYFFDEDEVIGEQKALPAVEVVLFSNDQSFGRIIQEDLGGSIHIDRLSDISHYNREELIQSVTNKKPTYVIFDLFYILDDFDNAMQLLQNFKQENQYIWIPQLDLDSRVTFANEFLDDIKNNYQEIKDEMTPTMLS